MLHTAPVMRGTCVSQSPWIRGIWLRVERLDLGAGCLETCWPYQIPKLESIGTQPAIQCAHVEDKAWESQELALSRVGKPGLMPAANPIQGVGLFRLPKYYISEL